MKSLKRIIIGIAVLVALVYLVVIPYIHSEARKFSPAKTVVLNLKGSELEVDYSSPSKKGRVIFGNLVPYGKIWRTGANEPTTFTTTEPIKIPSWGVTRVDGNQTTHESKYDYLTVEVPVKKLIEPVEDLSINFENVAVNQKTQDFLSLAWDSTKIMVPIYK